MNDFEALLAAQLAGAIENARASGRDDIADYLALKAANDSIRQRETDDLFKAFIGIALSAENVARSVKVERESPHSFEHANANIKGSLLRMARGLRCLTVDAGWTRAPADGFMRFGAMAVARIRHYGIPEKNAGLVLKPHADAYSWFEVRNDAVSQQPFRPEDVRRHLDIFLNDRIR
jgi:hypothetical protein